VRQATNIPCVEQNTEGRAPSDPRTSIFCVALELVHLAGLCPADRDVAYPAYTALWSLTQVSFNPTRRAEAVNVNVKNQRIH